MRLLDGNSSTPHRPGCTPILVWDAAGLEFIQSGIIYNIVHSSAKIFIQVAVLVSGDIKEDL